MMNKKIIAFTAAVSLLPASFSKSVSASVNYTISDLRHLRNALLRVSDITAADDINGDGVVNVVDLCLLKRALLTTGEFVEKNYAATEETVKLVGRTMYSNDTTWLVQSGS
ncbi:MAG: dockerin type I domain-containing protein, partial [Oscillospiraceae bacterium]|nr:dockerin type I domain-containing protein [Oscillospiraceae bacterium]